jgi:hypothetical protein
MLTQRRSGNRKRGNLLEEPAALVKAFLVKPLIPYDEISEKAQKYSQRGGLPCVIFLESSKIVETTALNREKRRLSDHN